uniref:hypothetical protein n=1 Tax=Klebsiella pneumoniae TaxID=573 RepID=UPI001D0E5438
MTLKIGVECGCTLTGRIAIPRFISRSGYGAAWRTFPQIDTSDYEGETVLIKPWATPYSAQYPAVSCRRSIPGNYPMGQE